MVKRTSILFLIMTFAFILTAVCAVLAAEETYTMDFNNEDVDTDAKEILEFGDMFEVHYGTGGCSATVQEGEEGNKYLALSGYIAFSSWDLMDSPYEFSVDAQMVKTGNIGFFVRSVIPVTKYNPKNGPQGSETTFTYFEADWYNENGGKNGSTGIGGSGISVMPLNENIRVNIKTYEPDGLKIANKFYDFPVPEGLNVADEFFNIKFKDDGEKVEIYINDNLLATIEMSEKGVYEEDEDDPNEYLKKAVIKDAEGNEVLNIDNARLSPGPSQIAIGCRNLQMNIDNLKVVYQAPDPTPTPEPTPEPEDTPTPEKTVSKSPDSNVEDDKEGGVEPIVIVAIVIAVVVVVSLAIVFIIIGKKKK